MMKKYRSAISKLLIAVLLVSVFSGLMPDIQAGAAGGRALDSSEASITDVTLTVDGNTITPDTPNNIPVSQTANVNLSIGWKLENVTDLQDGDYLEVDFPIEYFRGLTDLEAGELIVNGNVEIGTYIFTSAGKLRLTFNGTNLLNVGGTVTIEESKFQVPSTGNNPVAITFPVSGSAITYVKFAPSGVTSSITKDGSGNKDLNATGINWVIDVNKKLEPVNGAVVEDIISATLDFEPSSLKVYKLDVGLDGSVTDTGEELTGVTYTLEDSKLSINLGNIETAYRIKYSTQIKAEAMKTVSFSNTAEFKGIKDSQPALIGTANKTVNTPRGTALEKSGITDKQFNATNVTWTVFMNKNESLINEAVLKDTVPEGLILKDSNQDGTLDSEDILITPLVYSGGAWIAGGAAVPASDFTLIYTDNTTGTDELEVQFHQPVTTAYKIEYITDIIDSTKTSFRNSVDLYDESISGETPLNQTPVQAQVNIQRGPLLTKDGEWEIGYTDKYIEWTVDINKKEETITNPLLTDTIGAGLGTAENIRVNSQRRRQCNTYRT